MGLNGRFNAVLARVVCLVWFNRYKI